MAAPLPVNLLCGYLGAGKTTLLNRLLDRQGERILVMVNDFGDIAVDAALIAGRSADTIQLSNGCICCSMGGGLFDAFERALSLRDRVDRLVIEASGVAEPQRLAAFALAEPELDCRAVVAVVDPQSLAERLADPRIGRVAESQIRGADAVFLSRADIAGRAALRRAARLVARLNPLASQHLAVDGGFMQALATPHDGRSLVALAPDRDHGRLFASRIIGISPPPDREGLAAIIARHGRAIHRLKGYVRLPDAERPHLLQLAAGVLALEPAEAPEGMAMNRLVAIAPDAEALARLAAELEGFGISFGTNSLARR
ncbi:GTP-binding protein (plasmid) [Paracoccus sp. MA]|uniref:CobW family GTP-binding protein n=1 Tax=unclassified Paracoccus (in: a-proteobacteria) TaxID=2688777 RepID=UPI000490EEBA|nr:MULTISPECIES: CobW family GTP-binding protein [unclassified Paracoccus (in: a-proteobacteria)]UFM67375.1 GTP-binding protein [Paracoccus sp. MA]